MPRSLNHVITLARIQEERFNRQRAHTAAKAPTVVHPPRGDPAVENRPTVTKLTWQELQTRREKGLCFNCDEKYTRGHTCQKIQVFMLTQEEEALPSTEEGGLDFADLGVSLIAMEGCTASPTIRIAGRVGGEVVMILMDSGSTHNFIHPTMAHKTGLDIDRGASFPVMVADGHRLQCEGVLKGVELRIQGYTGRIDIYLLPIRGSDVVLGAQWLKQLRRVTFDWDHMAMEFSRDGKEYCLEGLSSARMGQSTAWKEPHAPRFQLEDKLALEGEGNVTPGDSTGCRGYDCARRPKEKAEEDRAEPSGSARQY